MPLKITFEANEINDYLRIDTGFDTKTVETIQKGAVKEAENFLNTDFSLTIVNEDGTTTTTPVEAPDDVKTWVLDRIVERYENRGKTPKPDFTTLQPHRVFPFKGFDDLKPSVEG